MKKFLAKNILYILDIIVYVTLAVLTITKVYDCLGWLTGWAIGRAVSTIALNVLIDKAETKVVVSEPKKSEDLPAEKYDDEGMGLKVEEV